MSKRQLFFFFLMAVIILAATSIPIKSLESTQNGDDQEVLIAGRNVNMVSGVTLPNGDPWLQRQNEPSIAVSTRNPLHLLAGANDYRTVDMPIEGEELPGQEMAAAPDAWLGLFKSFDGGQSWISMLLPGFPQDTSAEGMVSPLKYREDLGTGFRAAADPVVRAGTNGLFYYSGIAFNRTKIPGQINSVVFISRFIDNNNIEGGDSIKYIDTKIVADDGMLDRIFVDKPWIAVDAPNNYANPVTIDGQQIPRANVYIAYSAFSTAENSFTSEIIFRRSTDCGETWEDPIVLSGGHELNQGAVVAVDARGNSHVYVAWRRFNTEEQSSAIIAARSANAGESFHKLTEVACFDPFPYGSFDQPSTPDEILYPDPDDLIPGTSFRTNSYPTMTVDEKGTVYLAWAQRGWGPSGEARILLTTTRPGFHFEIPEPIPTPFAVQGHEFMPSLTYAGGKITLVWYDQRDSYCGQVYGFGDWINDYLPFRHTIDVWAAQADTSDFPNLNWIFTQVSRYLFHTEEDPEKPGTYKAYQAQFNPPNYPLFKSGTLPFHGDYLDITPSPMFVLDENGHWRFNTEPSDNPLFHVSWTDNRDVSPPDDGDWVNYGPPTSEQSDIYISENRPPCEGGQKPGMRNQNVYTSRITTGIEVGSPTNTKLLNLEVPRAFVIFVKNNTGFLKSFRLTIANQPPGGQASFLQFDLLETLDVSIAPYSTISRQVFVDSTDMYASVGINIDEIDLPGGIILPEGETGFILLNGDPTSPGISGDEETHQPEIDNPNIVNWIVNPNIVNPNIVNPNIVNPNIVNPNIVNPNIVNPNIVNPNIVNPNIVNPNIVNPNIVNPNIVNPNIVNPNIVNPNIVNPNIVNPNIVNPNIVNASPEDVFITDVEWPVRNAGNTASSFTFKIIAKEALPEGIYAQLIVYKVHYTPAVAGSGLSIGIEVDDCELKQAPSHEVLLSVVNPNIVNPNIVNPNIVNPNIVNAAIENATFILGPGEEAIVNLRIIDTSEAQKSRGISSRAWQPPDVQDFLDSLGGAVSSQSADSEDAEQGIEEPPAAATTLIISTSSLPPGVIDSPYPPEEYSLSDARLKAVGGTGPYSWWINPNDLPPGLSLDRVTGQIFGTPLSGPGTYHFTAQVTDSGSPQQSDNQALSITIEDPTVPPPDLTITSPSPLPVGTERKPYGTTLQASGGVWPYTWTKASGSLPAGFSLDSGGFISGMPEIGAAGTYSFRIRVTDSGMPADSDEKDFTLTIREYTAPTYTISGTVTIGDGGPPLPGVLIRGLPGAPTTDSSGFYTDTVPEDWSGTSTPFKAGYYFDPLQINYSQVNSDRLNQDYDAYSVELDHFEFNVIGNQTAGIPFSLTITAKDSEGNTVTTYTDTNTLSDTTGTISPTSTGAFANGVWTGEVTITMAAAEITVTTTGGGKTGQSNAFNVTAGALDHFDFDTIGNQSAGIPFNITISAKDAWGNTDTTYTGTNTLSDTTGTISPTITGAFTNSTWTGNVSINAAQTGVTITTSGAGKTGVSNAFNVAAGGPSTIRIEDAADGTGSEVDIKTIGPDMHFTVYAISRDAGNNFIGNVEVNWSLIEKTDGVADSDLIPAADNKSATFTGHALGTARIEASHVSLGIDTTGTISVIETQGDDAYEDNDDIDSAQEISLGTTTNLIYLDEDWYKIYIPAESAGKDLKVHMKGIGYPNPNESGDLDFGIWDGSQKLLAYTLSGSDDETLYIPDISEGWYHIGVLYFSQNEAIYLVTVEVGDNFGIGYISGRVTDELGQGLENAYVELYGDPFDWYNCRPLITTNADGYYKFGFVPGDYTVRFNMTTLQTYLQDLAPDINYIGEYYDDKSSIEGADVLSITANATISGIDAELIEGGIITGTVTDPYGTALERVRVRVYDSNARSINYKYSDENGFYAIDRIPPGYFKVFAYPLSQPYAAEWYDDKPSLDEATGVPVGKGQTVPGIDFQLTAGGSIAGRVTNEQGDGIHNIRVYAYDATLASQIVLRSVVFTDENGYYSLDHLPNGNIRVYFNTTGTPYVPEWYDDKYLFEESDLVLVSEGQTTPNIDAVLTEGGSIEGRVTDLSDNGLYHIYVSVFDIEGNHIKSAYTNQNGNYSIDGIPPGNHKVRFRPEEGNWAVEWYDNETSYASATPVSVEANQTTSGIDAQLAENGGYITGTVTDSYGSGIGGVRVLIYDSSIQAAVSWVPTNASGHYSAPRIPTSNVKVYFDTDYNRLISAPEFYDDQNTFENASLVPAQAGETISGINAVLGERSPLTVTTISLPGGIVATPYSATLGATGGTPNYHWCLAPGSNPLPTGLVIQSYGVIEGTPTSQGIFPVTVQVVDSGNPQQVATEGLSITISAYGGTDYIISGTVTYGGSPLKGVVMDGLPGNPQTNVLGNYLATVPSGWSGTVTPNLPGYSFDPPSRNYDGVTEHQEYHDYSAFYGQPLRITTTSLPSGTKDAAYSASLEVYAPDGIPPIEWSIIEGFLPDGLMLETSGEIHGVPSEAGDFIFTVQVTDSSSPQKSASQYLTLYIAPQHQGFWTTTYPYGGNINSAGLVLDPLDSNVIYAATNWRGIFKSEDAGSSWDSITDYLELPFDRTDTRILKVRRNPDEFFTVSHGRIFKSTDDGMSWDAINNGITGYVQALAFHPTFLNVLYAGTQENGIFKTADGGAGWFNVSSGLPADEIRSIAVDPDDPSIVYAGMLNNGIYKSTDDGMSWFSINNNIGLARIDDIVMNPVNTQIIYLAGNEPETGDGIFKSTDGGDTWVKLPVSVSYTWPSGNYIAIDPADTDIIYSVSYQSIFKSEDGGSNWTENQITPHHVSTIVIDPSPVRDPLTDRTLYAGTDTEGIFKSTDSGQNWTAVNSGIRALHFPRSRSHSLVIDQTDSDIIYAGSINGGLKSTNKGLSWTSLNLNEWQVGTLATHASDPGTVYAFQHNLWKSTDNGATWAQLTGSGDICCFGEGDFVIAPSNPSVFYLAGLWSGSTPNGIYKSIDSGSTWTLMNNGLTNENIRTLAVHPTNADIVFAGTMGDWPIDPATDYGLFKTIDGGQNWSHVNCGLPEVLHISQIAIYPGDPNIMYMASEGENRGVYRSDEGGDCWRNIFGDNASSVAIHPDDPDIVYVGTWNSGGFYVTLNGGGTWTQLNDGLPINPGIESIAIDPENPLHVFIGTTAGVYEATLNFDFSVTTEWLPEGVKDEGYSVTLEAMGGIEPYTWSIIEGELPTGLTMDNSGLITGVPTVPGTFYFRVQVIDNDAPPQSYTKILHITILNTYTLTTNINPGAGGSLNRSPDKPKYIQGEFVDLTITPNAGYTFTGWSGDASGTTGTIHVQMTRDKNITANFALTADLPDYTITSFSVPEEATAGDIIGGSVSSVIENQGAHDFYPKDIFVAVYLSSDPVITTSDILLWKGRSSIVALGAGGTTADTIHPDLQIPTTVSEGDYYIGVLVDESRVVAEQDEDNNYSSLPISIVSTEYGYFDIVGYWDGGSTYGIAVDEARNLALIGHGGALEILDISNPSNPVQRSQLHLSSSLVVTIVTSGNLAYIADGAAGLKVVDFSDADNPVEIGSCDTFQSGARSLDISGNYAYLTDYHHGLRVIDISTPTSPTEIAFLPLPYLSREVKVFGNYAYVTVRGHLVGGEGAPALRIIDISQPADPTLRSTYGFQYDIGIPAIDDTGQYLFVPTSGDGLRILDVSNPDLPSEISFYNGAPNQSEVTIRGNLAFLDDYVNSRAVILDISDVFNPFEISSYSLEDQQSLYGFEVAGNLWLVNRWFDSVKILDISNVYSIHEVGSYDETQGLLLFLDIADDHAFIINTKSNIDHLKVLDIANLSDITETATFDTPFSIYGIDISGNHAYIPTFDDGLRIADITDPSNPAQVGVYEDLNSARHAVVSGNYSYVADGWDGLRIFDISTPSNPILVSTWQIPGYAWSLSVSGNYVYIAGFRGGLRIIDVSDPLNPWEVGSLEFQGRRIRRVAVSENYAYITEEYKTLRVIDVSDPANPTEVSSFDTYYPMNLIISGNLLFVSDWLLGLKVMDISDPTHPTQIALLNDLFNAEQVVIEDNYIYVLNRDSGLYVLEYKLPGAEQTISGMVTFDGSPLQGVLMSGFPGNPITNGLGEYSSTIPTGWTGIVTPTLAGYFFNPPHRKYETVTSNQPNQDYTAYSGEPLVITTTWLPDGIVDTDYSETLQATGGTPDYTWSIVYASLPDGLNLNPSTGEINGIPTETGNITFTVQVTDSGLQQQSCTQELSININAYAGPGYIISGTVTADGLPLDGVVMTGLPENPTTNVSGFYMATVEDGWSGIAVPSKTGYTFDPSNRNYDSVASSQFAQDYDATFLVSEVWVASYNGPASFSSDAAHAVTSDSSGNIYVTGSSVGNSTLDDILTIKYNSSGDKLWEARYDGPGNADDYGSAIAVDSGGNVYVTGYGGWSEAIDFITIKYDSNGDQAWVARYDGPENNRDYGDAIAVDSAGNVYVTGRSFVPTEGYYDFATVKYDSDGVEQWAATYGGTGNRNDAPEDIAVDSSGNAYVTGWRYESGTGYDYVTIKYNSSTGDEDWVAIHDSDSSDKAFAIAVDGAGNAYVTGQSYRSGTSYDYATIKYDSAGTQVWIAWYDNASSTEYAQALALDPSGNVCVTGYTLVGGSAADYATVVYDNDGAELWRATYNGPENSDDLPNAIDADSTGNVYVTGRSMGSNVYNEYATVKYSSTGTELWVRRYDGSAPGNDQANDIVVDPSGDIVVTGMSHGSSTYNDYATVKYDSSGNPLWNTEGDGALRYNSPTSYENLNWVYGDLMGMDSNNNVYMSGYSYGDGTSLDFTTVKFDSSGNFEWAAQYNGPGNFMDYAENMVVDASGNVYVTGATYINGADRDYATVKYDSSGNEEWTATYDGPANGNDWGIAIAVDASGDVYVTGYSDGDTTRYDCTTIKYNGDTGAQEAIAIYNNPFNYNDEGWGITVDPSGNVYVTGTTYPNTNTRYDFLTIKYDSNLEEQWVRTHNGVDDSYDNAYFIALDSSNNIYVLGEILNDFAVVKYSNAGDFQWVATYDGPANGNEMPLSLAVDPAGNAYVTGMSDGTDVSRDFATVKYDSSGTEAWVRRYAGENEGSYDYGSDIAVDSSGNVYVVGRSGGTHSSYGSDCMTIKYDSAGDLLWMMRYNGPNNLGDFGHAVSVTSSGDVYVVGLTDGPATGRDFLAIKYSQVQTTDQTYEFIGKWGSYGTGDGEFDYPLGAAVDSAGYVYVVDNENNRVQKFTSDGTYVTQWGSFGSGNGEFSNPHFIAVDSSDNFYVTDTANNRVQKFTSDGTYITQWGSYGTGDGEFDYPQGIAVDSAGYVYVADNENARIQKFTSDGTYVTQWGSYGMGDNQFLFPSGMAVDSADYVYVVDSNNHRVQKFTSDGTFVTKWGSQGAGDGEFDYPLDIAVDSAGYVYVVDDENARAQKFTSNGIFVTKWGSSGSGDGEFIFPSGIVVDGAVYVYVVDSNNNRVQKFR